MYSVSLKKLSRHSFPYVKYRVKMWSNVKCPLMGSVAEHSFCIAGFSLTEAEKRAMKKKKSKSRKSKKSKGGAAGDGGGYGDSDEMNDDADDYPMVDIVAEDMPEGALESDEDDRLRDLNDPHRLLNFDDLEAAMLVS